MASASASFQFALPRGERPGPGLPGWCRPGRFNSRSREGSDDHRYFPPGNGFGFNSRSREGSDRPPAVGQAHPHVSIRAPARGATRRMGRRAAWARFQFALPRGERLGCLALSGNLLPFQFALPRGERRANLCCGLRKPRVSIRAPARGATPIMTAKPAIIRSFNSRSREGSDQGGVFRRQVVGSFNSRSREGSDDFSPKEQGDCGGFNSRSREGSDGYSTVRRRLDKGFNSRSREGSDARLRYIYLFLGSFNSRSREGSDPVLTPILASLSHVSIRAPARGATTRAIYKDTTCQVSIRAPARGATRVRATTTPSQKVSIRAPARGATKAQTLAAPQSRVSIRAPARGATRRRDQHPLQYARFNSRSREGSDWDALPCRAICYRFNSRSREGSDARIFAVVCANRAFQFALPRGERPL